MAYSKTEGFVFNGKGTNPESTSSNSGIFFNANENDEISEFERIENLLFNSTINKNDNANNEVINENTGANENSEIRMFEQIENILFNNTNNDEEEESEKGKRKRNSEGYTYKRIRQNLTEINLEYDSDEHESWDEDDESFVAQKSGHKCNQQQAANT